MCGRRGQLEGLESPVVVGDAHASTMLSRCQVEDDLRTAAIVWPSRRVLTGTLRPSASQQGWCVAEPVDGDEVDQTFRGGVGPGGVVGGVIGGRTHLPGRGVAGGRGLDRKTFVTVMR